jgi:streptogramin lyase
MAEGRRHGPDGALWLAHSSGVTRFDAQNDEWKTYDARTTKGVLADPIVDLAVASDGSVWIASETAHSLVLHLIPALSEDTEDTWRTYGHRDGIPDASIDHIAVGLDASIWLAFEDAETVARCVVTE